VIQGLGRSCRMGIRGDGHAFRSRLDDKRCGWKMAGMGNE
jgi:hypothetical protein